MVIAKPRTELVDKENIEPKDSLQNSSDPNELVDEVTRKFAKEGLLHVPERLLTRSVFELPASDNNHAEDIEKPANLKIPPTKKESRKELPSPHDLATVPSSSSSLAVTAHATSSTDIDIFAQILDKQEQSFDPAHPKLLCADMMDIEHADKLMFYVAHEAKYDKHIPGSAQKEKEDKELIEKFLNVHKALEWVCQNNDSSTLESRAKFLVLMNTIDHMATRRTPKYVYAIACGHLIVNRAWMEMCVKKKSLVNMNPYLVHAVKTSNQPSDHPIKSYASLKSFYDKVRLLHGYTVWVCVYIFKYEEKHTPISPELIIDMLKNAGASLVNDVNELKNHDPERAFVIFPYDAPRAKPEYNFNDCEVAQSYENNIGRLVIKSTWIFDSLTEYIVKSPNEYRVVSDLPYQVTMTESLSQVTVTTH